MMNVTQLLIVRASFLLLHKKSILVSLTKVKTIRVDEIGHMYATSPATNGLRTMRNVS